MREPRQITASQVLTTISNSMIGVFILSLPRITSEYVNSGAPLVTLLGLFLAILSILVITYVGVRFQNMSLIDYSKQLIGRPLTYLFNFLVIFHFTLLCSLIVREFSEILTGFLYPDTPMFVLIVAMLIVVSITARNDITTIAYIQFFYFPFIMIPIVFMLALALSEIDLRYVQPILGNATTLMDFVNGSIAIVSMPFIQIGVFIVTVLIPHTQESKHAIKGSILGIMLSGLVVFFMVFVNLGVFGNNELQNPLWPVYVLTRMIQLPAEILERLDILYVVVWIISAFTTILSAYLIVTYSASQLFSLKSHRVLSYIMVPVVLCIALIPNDLFQMYDYMYGIGRFGLILIMFYPLLLLLLSLIRKKKGGMNGETS